ncbi:MAG TPA: nuclear transport factor 2 family protein [Aeromicrobium sp.]|nr:nuclear transport factor 2 family protein [Aeromicrobium sp.]
MSEQANAEIVKSFYANFLSGNIDAVVELLAPDFEIAYSGPSIIPAAGTWHGHDGFRGWSEAALQGHLPPESLNVDEPIVSGDNVFVSGHVSLNVKPTGKTCETDFLHWWAVRDGKLASWRDYYDTYALAQAYIS